MVEDEPQFRAVAGMIVRIASDRPDLMLVELKTLQGPLRFAMPKGIAVAVSERIAEVAKELAEDRAAH